MARLRGYRVTSMRIPAIELAESTCASGPVRTTLERKRSRPTGPKRMSALQPPAQGRPPLDEYYNSLFTAFGPQHWWPGKTQFEVIVGAVLTQNTSWTNVERAISNLRGAGLLSSAAIEKVPLRRLERLIRSSGYFRQKARKLKAFCEFLRGEYGGSLKRMFETPTILLREKLLGVFGIGPETADSILLYAGDLAVFVVDAYTKRILSRHGWTHENAKYDDVRWMFEREFPGDVKRFNEFHALIVNTGKNFCRTHDPLCGACPLGRYLEEGR
jgi:endonuclease-3 related protein